MDNNQLHDVDWSALSLHPNQPCNSMCVCVCIYDIVCCMYVCMCVMWVNVCYWKVGACLRLCHNDVMV